MTVEELKKMIFRLEKAKTETHEFILEKSIEDGRERCYFSNNSRVDLGVHVLFFHIACFINRCHGPH